MIYPTLRHAFKNCYPEKFGSKNVVCPANEMIFYFCGKSEAIINDQKYICLNGSVLFKKAGQPHSFIGIKHTDYICISFFGDVDNLALETGVYQIENKRIFKLAQEIFLANKQTQYLYDRFCSVKLVEILYILEIENAQNNKEDNIYSLLKNINDKNYLNITVAQMAEMTSYSYDHFRHKFKTITGISPKEYILDKRINYAQSLLATKIHNCTEVAMICGFSNSSHFTFQFKKKFGITPKQFVKEINKNDKFFNVTMID